jgi:hypothetical protein
MGRKPVLYLSGMLLTGLALVGCQSSSNSRPMATSQPVATNQPKTNGTPGSYTPTVAGGPASTPFGTPTTSSQPSGSGSFVSSNPTSRPNTPTVGSGTIQPASNSLVPPAPTPAGGFQPLPSGTGVNNVQYNGNNPVSAPSYPTYPSSTPSSGSYAPIVPNGMPGGGAGTMPNSPSTVYPSSSSLTPPPVGSSSFGSNYSAPSTGVPSAPSVPSYPGSLPGAPR